MKSELHNVPKIWLRSVVMKPHFLHFKFFCQRYTHCVFLHITDDSGGPSDCQTYRWHKVYRTGVRDLWFFLHQWTYLVWTKSFWFEWWFPLCGWVYLLLCVTVLEVLGRTFSVFSSLLISHWNVGFLLNKTTLWLRQEEK